MLQDLGKITSNSVGVAGPVLTWPMAITAGDISRDGSRILVRNYQGKENSYCKNNTLQQS